MRELKQQFEMTLPDDAFAYEEFKAFVVLLAGLGRIWQGKLLTRDLWNWERCRLDAVSF
jgi:hypothetical protein